MARLFADTYAPIELLKGNPNYEKYSSAYLIATEFNIFELTYAVFRDYGRDEAAKVVILCETRSRFYLPRTLDYLDASEFRKSANKAGKKISLIDALGYSCSKRLGIKFLTGDREFIEMKNIEYIK